MGSSIAAKEPKATNSTTAATATPTTSLRCALVRLGDADRLAAQLDLEAGAPARPCAVSTSRWAWPLLMLSAACRRSTVA